MERILLAGLGGFALGLLAYSYVSFGWSGIAFALFTGCILVGLYTCRKQKSLALAGVVLIAASLGMARLELAPSELPKVFVPLVGTEGSLEGKVVAEPDLRESSQRVTMEIDEDGVKTRVLAVAPLFPEVSYGEMLRVEGLFERPEPFATDGGRIFAYDRFLAKDGVFAVVSGASLEVVGEREGFNHVLGLFPDLKRAGMNALSTALPEPHASLASGLILGGKQGLGDALLDDFVRSGLVHIVVLSGYNVMIVAEFVLRAFGFLQKRKAAWLAGATIAAFVLVAGAGAASVRAGIMAGIALYARASGRTYDALRALLLAGFLMVLASPLSLAYDPGLQLSFIATLGLIFGAPLAEARLAFIKSAFLREIASATIAAQVAVLPLLLYQNGLFSIVALPANLLVLPVVPLAMLASALAGVAGFLVPGIAPVVGLPAYGLLSYVIAFVEFSSGLPLAAFSVPAFPAYMVMVAYAAVAYFVAVLTRRTGRVISLPERSSP